ncbi:MAG: hypothetical protein ACE5DI_02930 [Candidatus Micrarchaeia archaeon]
MELVFESKARRVGSSLGFLIPQSVALEGRLREGSAIKVFLVKKDMKAIENAFGMVRGAKSFVRDHKDRF